MNKTILSRVIAMGILVLAIVGLLLALRGQTVQIDTRSGYPALAVGDERTITLAVDWGGDVHQSTRLDCGVWTASWNCELRKGGGLETIMTRTLPISATAAVGTPGTGQWGTESTLTWDTSTLGIGDYETFVRLEITDGEETLHGYIEGEGQDGEYFFVADKFHIGQTCFVPLRFSVTAP